MQTNKIIWVLGIAALGQASLLAPATVAAAPARPATPITVRPASASSSVNPLRCHVLSNDPPHPCTSTTGLMRSPYPPARLRSTIAGRSSGRSRPARYNRSTL